MANGVKQRIELGITNSEGRKGILTLRTDKGYRGGVRSDGHVTWSDGRFESCTLLQDFSMVARLNPTARATQKAIDAQHAAVFTPDVVEAITAEAKGFYAAKAVVYQTLCHECAAISKVTQYGAPDKNYCEACGKVFESPDLATFQAAVAA